MARQGFENITRHGKLRQGAFPRGWVGHGKDFENKKHTTNHRSSLEVRWRLIPVANDSPVVFLEG